MTYESTQTRVFLQQYLVNQLCATNNVFVKIRVLNLFLVLLEEGHLEFKQNLRKQPEAFNEASSKFIVDSLGVCAWGMTHLEFSRLFLDTDSG